MNKLTHAVVGTTAAVLVAGAGAGTALADTTGTPGADTTAPSGSTVSVQILPGIQYTGDATTRSTLIDTPLGKVTSLGNQFIVRDAQGKILWGDPGVSAPAVPTAGNEGAASAEYTAKTVAYKNRLVSSVTPAARPDEPVTPVDGVQAKPVDQTADFEGALGTFAENFGVASGVGATVGGVTGALIGCPLGAITGGALAAPTVALTPLGAVAGCAIGIATIGGAGALVGGALVSVPVGIASAVQMYNALHAKGDV